MEIGLREWLVVGGVIVIALIILDGWRRMNGNRRRLKMDIDPTAADLPEEPVRSNPELPNGGARVVGDDPLFSDLSGKPETTVADEQVEQRQENDAAPLRVEEAFSSEPSPALAPTADDIAQDLQHNSEELSPVETEEPSRKSTSVEEEMPLEVVEQHLSDNEHFDELLGPARVVRTDHVEENKPERIEPVFSESTLSTDERIEPVFSAEGLGTVAPDQAEIAEHRDETPVIAPEAPSSEPAEAVTPDLSDNVGVPEAEAQQTWQRLETVDDAGDAGEVLSAARVVQVADEAPVQKVSSESEFDLDKPIPLDFGAQTVAENPEPAAQKPVPKRKRRSSWRHVEPEAEVVQDAQPAEKPAAAVTETVATEAITHPAEAMAETPEPAEESSAAAQELFAERPSLEKTPEPESVLAITVLAGQQNDIAGEQLLPLVKACGMRYGDMKIFHRFEDGLNEGAVQFSMANALNPGTFDLETMDQMFTRGLTFFMSMEEPRDVMNAFECMLATAETVAKHMGAELLDENRSVLRPQTKEHYRQRIRDFEMRNLSRRAH